MPENKIRIGVTGTGSLIGQGILKCIRDSRIKDRVELTGFDYIPNTVGSYWCDHNYLLPDIFKGNEEEAKWLDSLEQYIQRHELQMLFIGIDFELPVFARLKETIEDQTGCIVLVSSPEVISISNDKYLTAKFLKDNNLPHPLSFTSDEYDEGALKYPMIVKPRVGARSRGVFLVNTPEDLKNALSSVSDPVIQENIGSMDTEYTCGIIFLEGKVHASIALSRTLKEGNTFSADYQSNTPSSVYRYIEDVALALKPNGVVNFQLRLDSEQVPKLFEINPRHSGTTYMRSLFGYNEIEYIICFLLNDKLPVMDQLKEGKAIRFYQEQLV